MNYDLMTWIEYFVGAFACCLAIFFSGKIFLNKRLNEIKFYKYFLLVIFSLLLIVNSLLFDNIGKIIGTLCILFLIFKLIFNEDYVNAILYTVVSYILFILSETSVSIFVIIVEEIFEIDVMFSFIKSIFINFVISILSCIYAYFLKNKIKVFVNIINKNNIFYTFILGVITIFVAISSMYNLYLNNWTIDYKFVLNIIVIAGCLVLTLVLLKQYLKNKEIMDKYIILEDYLKTSADLVEKHSSTIHKYKNNLIAIKGYLKSDIKEANNYIDTLIENYKTKKYSWFSKLNYIKIDIVRYLVYCKLSKAEALNLKISVDVSSDIKKINNNKLTVYKINILLDIIGEYFDNAIYASNESKEKEINFVLYLENDKLIFILANTYKEKVDLSLITKNGYTTKGKGNGLGLYDIDKTLKSIPCFEVKYELLDNYFVVSLTIDTTKTNKS